MYLGLLLQCFYRNVMLVSSLKQCQSPKAVTKYVILWFASLVCEIVSHHSCSESPEKLVGVCLLCVSDLVQGIGQNSSPQG